MKTRILSLLLFLALVPLCFSAVIVDPSVDILLRFDETSGNTFFDASGHGRNGTCSTSQCPQMNVRGEFGGGAHFNGSSNVVFATVDVSETSYTSSVWFQTTNPNTGIFSVVDQQGNNGHDRHIYLSGGNPCTRVWNNETICGSGKSLADGQWHHIAHVFGGKTGGQHIYVDGVLVATGSKAQSDFNWQTQIAVGYSLDSSNPKFTGTIDEVTVYHRDLSAQEVKTLYEKGAFRQNAAIDPAGRFVVYAGMPAGCLNQRPIFQPILNGKPSGTPKLLMSCTAMPEDVLGFDLLRDGATNDYWLAFEGSQNTDSKFLMKINSSGAILQSPKAVVSASSFGYLVGATALLDSDPSTLRMWFPGTGGMLMTTLISKSSLTPFAVKKTAFATMGTGSLQASQGPNRRFLATEYPNGSLRAFGLDSTGWTDGTIWRISPRTDGGHRTGGVSSDGLMALSADRYGMDKLYEQPLNTSGRAASDPRAMVIGTGIGSADVSGPLGTMRIVVYGSPTDFYLQKIDAITGDKLGLPAPLN